jgi:hypothetical protein
LGLNPKPAINTIEIAQKKRKKRKKLNSAKMTRSYFVL